MTPSEAHDIADLYLAPECAAALLVRAVDAQAPSLAARCAQALRWLDVDDHDPAIRPRGRSAGDELSMAIITITHRLVYGADAATRLRCAGLVNSILAEAARVDTEQRRAA